MVTTGAGSRARVMAMLDVAGYRKGCKDLREKATRSPSCSHLPGCNASPAINLPGSNIQTGTAVKV